jgi:hypothetical protein
VRKGWEKRRAWREGRFGFCRPFLKDWTKTHFPIGSLNPPGARGDPAARPCSSSLPPPENASRW